MAIPIIENLFLYADKIAIKQQHTAYSYRELKKQSAKIASFLLADKTETNKLIEKCNH